jgi:hypothetical protein
LTNDIIGWHAYIFKENQLPQHIHANHRMKHFQAAR